MLKFGNGSDKAEPCTLEALEKQGNIPREKGLAWQRECWLLAGLVRVELPEFLQMRDYLLRKTD